MKTAYRALLIIALLIIILMSLISVVVGCDYSRGSIEGKMTDESSEPVAGAIIRAERS